MKDLKCVKNLFVVNRQHWIDTQTSPEDAIPQSEAAFTDRNTAMKFIQNRLKDYPEENVFFNGNNGACYDDGETEYDIYSICEVELNPELEEEECE